MEHKIQISPEIKAAAPEYRVILIEADVKNSDTPAELSELICKWGENIVSVMEMSDINKRPGIAATRAVYKRTGKDPNRYRPSHEQMMRRFFKGQGLYEVSAIVDAGNLLSLMSGYSVGVFDADKVKGETLTVGIGKAHELYEGVGRGPLNIEGLPVVRDAVGGIGSPTSDNERTKTSLDTRRIVVTIHVFGEDMPVNDTIALATELLTKYCVAENIEVCQF
ncbi:MAG: hypothetical protein K2M37_07600 [Muribaculaceae bacterium]|nr:hypothetical protein [Muribaculaceae bacterium]